MTINIDVTNLDAVMSHSDADDLEEFSRNLTRLARYAGAKASAMRHRLRGHITLAAIDEAECEHLYNSLPREWKW